MGGDGFPGGVFVDGLPVEVRGYFAFPLLPVMQTRLAEEIPCVLEMEEMES